MNLPEGYTCAIYGKDGEVALLKERGVSGILALFHQNPDFLCGATVYDKIVGRAAASIFIYAGIRELHTPVLSGYALSFLESSDIHVCYDTLVDHVINRDGNGWCPMETLCRDCRDPEECISRIEKKLQED